MAALSEAVGGREKVAAVVVLAVVLAVLVPSAGVGAFWLERRQGDRTARSAVALGEHVGPERTNSVRHGRTSGPRRVINYVKE